MNNIKDFIDINEDSFNMLNLLSTNMIIISFSCFLISILNNNYSQVDRLWSILPSFYNIVIFISQKEKISAIQIISSVPIFIWSIRLTYNFYIKDGYKIGNEDYRWGYLRKNYITNRILFQIFNLFFISFYQNILILLFSLPSFVIYLNKDKGIDFVFLTLIFIQVMCIIGESIADYQMYEFQNKKYELLNEKIKEGMNLSIAVTKLPKPYNLGFITSGLFKYSRHPNYFFEILHWWVFYLVASYLDSKLFNFTFLGPLLLNLLFLGSTTLAEIITSEKFESYKKYQQEVSRIIPLF